MCCLLFPYGRFTQNAIIAVIARKEELLACLTIVFLVQKISQSYTLAVELRLFSLNLQSNEPKNYVESQAICKMGGR